MKLIAYILGKSFVAHRNPDEAIEEIQSLSLAPLGSNSPPEQVTLRLSPLFVDEQMGGPINESPAPAGVDISIFGLNARNAATVTENVNKNTIGMCTSLMTSFGNIQLMMFTRRT